jgi:hypothetical protein
LDMNVTRNKASVGAKLNLRTIAETEGITTEGGS